jgi:hypothetical protein
VTNLLFPNLALACKFATRCFIADRKLYLLAVILAIGVRVPSIVLRNWKKEGLLGSNNSSQSKLDSNAKISRKPSAFNYSKIRDILNQLVFRLVRQVS